MLNMKLLLAISMLCFVAGGPTDPTTLKPPTNITTVLPTPSSNITTVPPIQPTTSPKPPAPITTTTTTSGPNITTTSTTTTTTTTPKPTTTSTKTTTASTTAKPPTTPAPPPVDPVQGKWVANYTNTNSTCLILEAALQIDIPYKVGNDTKIYKVNVPPTANSTGNCGNGTESISLSFIQPKNTVNFYFKKTNDTKKYDLSSVVITLNVTIPAINVSELVTLSHTKDEFVTPLSNSYKCAKEQTFNLSGVMPVGILEAGELRISHLQVQAFRNSSNAKFDEALDCAGSETPDVVPIAVGCALAALVIIVLVAYLIGRRRSQARGYLSM